MIPYQSVHFVGVLTPEMASLACYTAKLNIRVSGSCDGSQSIYIEPLRSVGVTVYEMFAQVNVGKHIELVVISRYYDMRHIEADAALKAQIPVVSETDYIRLIMNDKPAIIFLGEYESRLAASYLSVLFAAANNQASSLTTTVSTDGNNMSLAHPSESGWFILPLAGFKRDATTYEADFLSFTASVASIPSLRYDYPELNTTLDEVYQNYYAFAKRTPRRGMIVGNSDFSRMRRLRVHLADRNIITYGEDVSSAWQIDEYTPTDHGARFSLKNNLLKYGPYEISAFTKAAISAAAAAIIIAISLDIETDLISKTIPAIGPFKRFNEIRQDVTGRTIIDDQADHPELIQDILSNIKLKYPTKKIWCLYQAGSYLRTKAFYHELGQALSLADFVYIAPVSGYYREKSEGVDIRQLVSDMKSIHSQTYYFDDADTLSQLLAQRVTSTDCIVTLGVEGKCQKTIQPLLKPDS